MVAKKGNLQMDFIYVALGGALGAVARYSISLVPVKTAFPILTLITNLLGAVLIGFVVGITSKNGKSDSAVLFWKTGVCGGFTTFSTFSLEAYKLFEDKAYVPGGVYVALSVTLCIAGVFMGEKIVEFLGA